MTQVNQPPTAPTGRSRRTPDEPSTPLNVEELAQATEAISRVSDAFSSRVVGQHRVRTALLVTLLAEGHVLLESVPGLAKTLAASTLSQAVSARFARIQCTPDLLPSDIIGTQVYDPRRHEFETQLGPVHANFVLLDEINRASAKTQSALLEAMQERQTSIAGAIHPLPDPFMVLATQNPIEEEGTYVLPHAQMDRFLLKEIVDYPSEDDELMVLERIDDGTLGQHMTDVTAVITPHQVAELQELVRRVYVDPAIRRYITSLVRATRDVTGLLGPELGNYVEIGASPRGSIAFFQAARAMAVVQGRHYVIPEDVRELRHSVLRHRLHLSFEALADRVRPETVIDAVFRAVPTP
ncbi:AAA family ATPase [Nocardioides nitrophenolicus]|uniref:AAA family ATPase n=1 Tax=Nocardioides nitrophenolicus TaxID=60489 RepID=UPI00195AA168|nr:MoxR family ATPase [Nocardioides nitrophenolicus]MBM7519070.1 MoxR-like ATPase [Nocardioides nitrophenolicus]